MTRGIVTFTGLAAALSVLAMTASSGVQAQQGEPESQIAKLSQSRWLTESGNLEVELAPCGTALCGAVVKVLANRSMADPSKTVADSAPVLGLKILHDFTPVGSGELRGTIYNRENGKTYDCVLSLQSPDELQVRPYVGIPLFGKTQIWRRVSVRAPK